jgi:hypothetical protein
MFEFRYDTNSLVVVININRLKEKYSIISVIAVKLLQFQTEQYMYCKWLH